VTFDDDYINLSASAPPNRVALLLAGGDGSRLQELTTEIAGIPIPKQYCCLLHGSSLLEATLCRVHLFAQAEHISIVVNQNHIEMAKKQLGSLPASNIFIQPKNLDTGPGIIFALLRLEQTHPDAIVAVFPTDHYIDNDRAFIAHTLRAVNLISFLPEKIAVLGIVPDRPATGYGYILPGHRVESSEKAYYVEAFTEKPELSKACDIISRGGLWNTFVMVFKLSRMLDLLSELVPGEFAKLSKLRILRHKADEIYRTLVPWNFSTQVLARIPQHLIMLEVADVQWSDWGTRESVERTYRVLNLVPSWNMASRAINPIPG
jgi:mannose-1-phosphate guanylyltransferase